MNTGLSRVFDEEILYSKTALAAAFAVAAGLLYLAVTQPAGVYEQVLVNIAAALALAIVAYPVVGKPVLGLFALVPATILPPLPVGGQSGAALAYVAAPAIFGAWLLTRLSAEGGAKFIASPVFRPLMLLLVVVVAAFGIGQYDWFGSSGASMSARLGGLGVFFASAAVFIVAAHEFRDIRWLRRTTWAFFAVGAVVLISALLSELGIQSFQVAPEEQGIGSAFWTWLASLSFAQAVINKRLSFLGRGLCLMVTLGVLALTMGPWRDWASGWAPATVGIGVAMLMYRPRVTIVLGAIAAGVLFINAATAREVAWTEDQAYSTKTRIAAAETLFQIAKENPILGFGPANYHEYTPMFPILGYYVRFSSHNNYFDLVLQTGLCGLLCVGWLWFELGAVSWLATRWANPGFELAYAHGAMGGLAGTVVGGMLGDWFLPFVYNVGLHGFATSVLSWLFLGGLVAVAAISSRRPVRVEA